MVTITSTTSIYATEGHFMGVNYMKPSNCTFDGCDNNRHTRLYCNSHYNQLRRTGRVWPVQHRKTGCVIQDCQGKHCAYGYCEKHYDRLKRNGDPEKTVKNWTVSQRNNHGLRQHPLYRIWDAMKQRCTNPNTSHFELYGGRGIKVCDRWLENFQNFLDDMGERPSPKHSLDRIDTNGNYEPSNCRWATSTEQILNRRMNKNNTTGAVGVYRSFGKWSAEIWVDYKKKMLGRYDDFEDAVRARKQAEALYRGGK